MTVRPPTGLSSRARGFWRDVHADGRTLSALEVALLVEVVRLMTRADRLEKELAGGLDRGLLTEARLTAIALKGAIAELRQHNAGGRPLAGVGPGGEAEQPRAVDAVDQLSARRASRRAEAAGGALPRGED